MSSEHFNVDGTPVDAGELVRLGRRFARVGGARFGACRGSIPARRHRLVHRAAIAHVDLELVANDVREALRRYFVDGRIVLTVAPEGHHVAEGRFLPLVALTDSTLDSTPFWGRLSCHACPWPSAPLAEL